MVRSRVNCNLSKIVRDDRSELVAALRRKLRVILVYKYALIFCLIAAGGLILFLTSPPVGTQLRAFAETFLYSGVVALILSLLNDVVLRSEAEELAKIDRDQFASRFAREFFLNHADAAIADDLLERLMASDVRRSTVIRSLANLITADPKLKSTVEQSYLEPLRRPPRFHSVRAISQLRRFEAGTGRYEWYCRQTFSTVRPISEYRIFVCSDNDIAAIVEASSRATDFVILLSDIFRKDDVKRWISSEIEFTVSVVDAKSSRVVLSAVERTFDIDELRRNPGCESITEDDGLYCRYFWPITEENCDIEMRFGLTLSLVEDPYFVWTFQDYAFVDSIEIDYSGLRSAVGRASPILYIRNPGCSINHNRNAGILRVMVGGLAGPGEGAVLIFRPRRQNA